MSKLLQILNANASKTPDEIASFLNRNGWRKPSELGEEWFNENKNTLPCWYMRVDNDDPEYGMTNLDYFNDEWVMANCSPNYNQFCQVLETRRHTYWIIPKSEYRHGYYPPGVTCR